MSQAKSTGSESMSRAALLRELGYGHPDAAGRALEILVAAGLTSPRKDGIATAKRERVREELGQWLVRLCERCAPSRVDDGRERVPVADHTDCERCLGSANRAAIDRAVEVLRGAHRRRLVVVGGSPGVHEALRKLWPEDMELRIIDGTERHTGQEARGHLAWADAIVVWASSELNHKVSEHYTGAPDPLRQKVTIVPRRGIEALAVELAARFGRPAK